MDGGSSVCFSRQTNMCRRRCNVASRKSNRVILVLVPCGHTEVRNCSQLDRLGIVGTQKGVAEQDDEDVWMELGQGGSVVADDRVNNVRSGPWVGRSILSDLLLPVLSS